MVNLNKERLAKEQNDIAERVVGLLVQMVLQHSIGGSTIT